MKVSETLSVLVSDQKMKVVITSLIYAIFLICLIFLNYTKENYFLLLFLKFGRITYCGIT